MIDLADPSTGLAGIETTYDGQSLRAELAGDGEDASRLVYAEMSGERAGRTRPVMVMRGRTKYIHCEGDPAQLYDRASDPR